MADSDALVSDYLGRLDAAAGRLPADRRAELIEEISAHITQARAQSPASIAGPDSDLLDLLARLGDPEEIVRAASDPAAPGTSGPGPGATTSAARASASPTPAGPGAGYGGTATFPEPGDQPRSQIPHWPPPAGAPAASAPSGPAASGAGQTAAGPGGLEIAAVLLSIGSVILLPVIPGLAVVGWLAGIVLLWYSPRWRPADKWLGTLVWPVGIGLALALRQLPLVGPHPEKTGGLYALLRLAEAAAAITAAVIITVRLLRRAGQTPA